MPNRGGTTDADYVRKLAELRAARGNRCEDCGRKNRTKKNGHPSLQWSHEKATGLQGRGRGARRRFLDVRDHPQCYKLRCNDCHRKVDRARAACGVREPVVDMGLPPTSPSPDYVPF